MRYQVKLTARANRELAKLPKDARVKITDSLDLLGVNPFAEILQFKKLRGNSSLYRIRVGNYRVIYEIRGEILTVIVVRVGHRKDVYDYLKRRS